tara:strand:+ start:2070 stop:2231 length:162 start_codon:yes stop_codon:yes gene_type:complete
LIKQLSVWGDITKYGYNDESLSDFSPEIINSSYLLPTPVINENHIIDSKFFDI